MYFPSLPENSDLAQFSFLIGTWNVEMNHTALPEPLNWQDTFSWLDSGFIVWHWQGKKEVPSATLIIARNEQATKNKFNILYYDARGISRFMNMSFENSVWTFWREGADFFQRSEYTINKNDTMMRGHGEMSHDSGKTWEHDFSITYTKVKEGNDYEFCKIQP